MGKFIETILFSLRVLPAVMAAAREIENQLPEKGMGKEKLGLILDVVQATGSMAEEVLPVIKSLVSVVVKFFNTVGVFQK